jgi:cytochrome c biogenesis protein CcdA
MATNTFTPYSNLNANITNKLTAEQQLINNLLQEIETELTPKQIDEQPLYNRGWFWLTILAVVLLVSAGIFATGTQTIRFWFWLLIVAGVIVAALAIYDYLEEKKKIDS